MTRESEAPRGAWTTYAGRELCRSCGKIVGYRGLLDGSPVTCPGCGACVLIVGGLRPRRGGPTVPPAVMVRQACRLAVWRSLADDAAAPPPPALVTGAELPPDGLALVREHARRHAAVTASTAYPYWTPEDRAAVVAAAGPMSAPMAALRSGPRPAWCYQEAGCGHLLDAWSPALSEDPHGCRVCGVLAGGRR